MSSLPPLEMRVEVIGFILLPLFALNSDQVNRRRRHSSYGDPGGSKAYINSCVPHLCDLSCSFAIMSSVPSASLSTTSGDSWVIDVFIQDASHRPITYRNQHRSTSIAWAPRWDELEAHLLSTTKQICLEREIDLEQHDPFIEGYRARLSDALKDACRAATESRSDSIQYVYHESEENFNAVVAEQLEERRVRGLSPVAATLGKTTVYHTPSPEPSAQEVCLTSSSTASALLSPKWRERRSRPDTATNANPSHGVLTRPSGVIKRTAKKRSSSLGGRSDKDDQEEKEERG